MSKYILKNKDKNVLEFEVETIESLRFGVKEYYDSIKDIEIINKELLPLNLSQNDISSSLLSWIKNRKVSKNRQFVEQIVSTYGGNEKRFMDYVDISLALSLNDSFWIVPADKDYKWKDYNLYKNEFSEALKLVAFTGVSNKVNGFTSSPEYTTNGMLKKCWHRENNEIYLYKGQSKEYANMGKEAYNEYYMAQVAKAMNFNAITYDLKLFHNELVSSCPIFTNENEGYVPIYYLLNKKEIENARSERTLLKIMNIYGKEAFEDLMIFDALIGNKDRHLGNFGMIVDNDTGKILRPAPIFDNGWCIINHIIKDELKMLNELMASKNSYFDFTFDKQLELFVEPRHTQNLQKLSNFTFKRHKEFNLSEEWLKPIEECIRTRAKMALQFIKEKQNTSIQNQTKEENLPSKEINAKLDEAIKEQSARVSKPKPNYEEQEHNENLENSYNQNSNKKLNKRK